MAQSDRLPIRPPSAWSDPKSGWTPTIQQFAVSNEFSLRANARAALDEQKESSRLHRHEGPLKRAFFGPKNSVIIVGEHTIQRFDDRYGKPSMNIRIANEIQSVNYDPKGRRLLVSDEAETRSISLFATTDDMVAYAEKKLGARRISRAQREQFGISGP